MLRIMPDRCAWVSAALLLASCGGGGGGEGSGSSGLGATETCPVDDEKEVVLSIMEEWYFWNDEPDQSSKYLNLDLAQFEDANELLDFLRFMPEELDRNFSFITTVEEDETFFGAGQTAAFGINIRTESDAVWINDVFTDSPADQSGLSRGDRIVSIDGVSISEIEAGEGVSAALGPREAGVTRELGIEFGDGGSAQISLTKAIISIDPLPAERVRSFQRNGRQVGYLLLRSFVATAEGPLMDAFQELGNAGVQDLVVDLRYNGGGLIRVAQTLASYLLGPGNTGNIFSEQRFNARKAGEGFNERLLFLEAAGGPSLERVVFIVTGASASASEMVINGLEPYALPGPEILLVGDTTGGKPVGQIAVDYCPDPNTGEFSKRLRPVAFETVNVLGQGRYFDGLPVDCPAVDDLSQGLGDPAEDSLATALELATTGACPGLSASAKPQARGERRRETGGTGGRYARVW